MTSFPRVARGRPLASRSGHATTAAAATGISTQLLVACREACALAAVAQSQLVRRRDVRARAGAFHRLEPRMHVRFGATAALGAGAQTASLGSAEVAEAAAARRRAWEATPACDLPQPVLNRRLRRGSFADFTALAREVAPALDEANLAICLGRLARKLDGLEMRVGVGVGAEVGEAERADEDCRPLAWLLISRCGQGLATMTSPYTLANLAWALVRLEPLLGEAPRDVLAPRELARLVVQRALAVDLATFPGRDLPVIIWSAAMLHRDYGLDFDTEDVTLLPALTTALLLRLPEFEAQGLAMVLWSCAVLDGPRGSLGASAWTSRPARSPTSARALFVKVAHEVEGHVEKLNSREVANVAWSYATLQVQMPKLLVDEMPRRATDFKPQECANALWALASLSLRVDDLSAALLPASASTNPDSESMARIFSAWKPQEMANAAWALAEGRRGMGGRALRSQRASNRMGDRRATLSDALLAAVAMRVDELNSAELAMVASSLPESHARGRSSNSVIDALMARSKVLLDEDALAPDAVMQIVEGLLAVHAKPALAIQAEYERNCSAADTALQGVAAGVSSGELLAAALSELRALRLTSLGAIATEEALWRIGIDVDRLSDDNKPMAGLALVAGQVWCWLRYHLLLTREPGASGAQEHRSLTENGRVLLSGGPRDTKGLGSLRAAHLLFPRDRDAEFLALTSVVGAVRRVTAEGEAGIAPWEVCGTISLRISQPPCLSCVSAMVQFRKLFPDVRLDVSFGDGGGQATHREQDK